jgi:hypothetical protein
VFRIRYVYPGSGILIFYLKTSYYFLSHKFHKIKNYFIFVLLNKKIWPSFQRIIELFNQKFVTKLKKIYVWDPGSGTNLFRIRVQGSKRPRIRIRNTGKNRQNCRSACHRSSGIGIFMPDSYFFHPGSRT